MADRLGQQLGNYRLTRLLGRGGFADVYLGEHIHLDTYAAIKVLHTELTSEDVEQFRTEARTLAHLAHPQIIRLLDFGIEGGIPFLVMDYAPNGSLRQRYPRGVKFPLNVIVPAVTQVAEALQYAHDEKLVHRDIKPENMFLSRRNEVVLGDFGIAVLSRTSRSQNMQDITGTVAYMAPEQLQGMPSRASDQYSLGIVVYEWLSGDVPFHGAFIEIASQHMLTPPPSLREKVLTLPPMVEQVVLKALEKDPQKRFGNVREFAQALVTAFGQANQPTYTPTAEFRPPVSGIPPTIQPTPRQYSATTPQKTKKQWLDEGNAHYKAQQYKEAIVAYNYAIVLDPNDAITYFARGSAYGSLNEYQLAIADFDQAIALNPEYANAYNNRGLAYSYIKAYQLAIADYDQAIALNPEYAGAYNNRGLTYYYLKKYQRAIADYNRALALDPGYASAYNNRGNVYMALMKYRKAIIDYDQTIALDPNDVRAYINRGRTYCVLKDYLLAIQDFKCALSLDPRITWLKYELEEAYRKLKR